MFKTNIIKNLIILVIILLFKALISTLLIFTIVGDSKVPYYLFYPHNHFSPILTNYNQVKIQILLLKFPLIFIQMFIIFLLSPIVNISKSVLSYFKTTNIRYKRNPTIQELLKLIDQELLNEIKFRKECVKSIFKRR